MIKSEGAYTSTNDQIPKFESSFMVGLLQEEAFTSVNDQMPNELRKKMGSFYF